MNTPGPAIWAWAIATPLAFIGGVHVWWPYWVVTALAYYLIIDWAYKKWWKNNV